MENGKSIIMYDRGGIAVLRFCGEGRQQRDPVLYGLDGDRYSGLAMGSADPVQRVEEAAEVVSGALYHDGSPRGIGHRRRDGSDLQRIRLEGPGWIGLPGGTGGTGPGGRTQCDPEIPAGYGSGIPEAESGYPLHHHRWSGI